MPAVTRSQKKKHAMDQEVGGAAGGVQFDGSGPALPLLGGVSMDQSSSVDTVVRPSNRGKPSDLKSLTSSKMTSVSRQRRLQKERDLAALREEERRIDIEHREAELRFIMKREQLYMESQKARIYDQRQLVELENESSDDDDDEEEFEEAEQNLDERICNWRANVEANSRPFVEHELKTFFAQDNTTLKPTRIASSHSLPVRKTSPTFQPNFAKPSQSTFICNSRPTAQPITTTISNHAETYQPPPAFAYKPPQETTTTFQKRSGTPQPPPTFVVNAPRQPPTFPVNASQRQPTYIVNKPQPIATPSNYQPIGAYQLDTDPITKLAESLTHVFENINLASQPGKNMDKMMARQSGMKELPEFHGDPEEWPLFYGRFETSTKMCGFSNEENLIRLQRSLKGKAKETVLSMLSSGCKYQDVIDILQRRFGRPELIIRRMVDKARGTPAPAEGDFQSLVDFDIVVKNFVATATSLKMTSCIVNPQLLEEFRRKLPFNLQLEWGKNVKQLNKEPTLQDFSSFLDEISAAAVYVCDNPGIRKQRQRDHTMTTTESQCVLKCKDNHILQSCPRFKRMKINERYDLVKKHRMCFQCLTRGHQLSKCSDKTPCKSPGCDQRHHSLLHYEKKNSSPVKENPPRENAESSERGPSRTETTGNGNFTGVMGEKKIVPVGSVLLKILPVEVTGPNGVELCNAFLDTGSTVTMIEEDLAHRLGLDGPKNPLNLTWTSNQTDYYPDSRMVSFKIRGIDEEQSFILQNVRTKKNLQLPTQPLSDYKLLRKWKHLEGIPFPEVLSGRPMILIGVDYLRLMLSRRFSEGPKNSPIACWTLLGWVVHGCNGRQFENSHISCVNIETETDEDLHELVKQQFRLDSYGVSNESKLPLSKCNQRAEQLMEENTHRVADRWETGLLWKTDNLKLPNSKPAALRRLKVLEKQLDKDANMCTAYCSKIEEYLSKGFCYKLTSEEAAMPCEREWWLCHFGRTNPNKPGKLRLVFDCAAKVDGSSLNDGLIQGPDLMTPLLDVLMKFRLREVAFSGDIRDMFHMVLIRKEDLPALRFLWRGRDRDRAPDVYQMSVMVFGAVSSPYQAQWVKNRNASDFADEFPAAVDAIHNRHYVDDYLDSCSTTEEAIQRIQEVREIHKRGGFEIRGWQCNIPEVLRSVAPEEQEEKDLLHVKENNLERVLGLYWDPKLDIFKFKAQFRNISEEVMSGEKYPTKRELLRLIMSLFDPMGFLGHLTVRGRMLLQDVWKSKISWDECLDESCQTKWRSLLQQLLQIPDAVIPRRFSPNVSQSMDLQLHTFCDASSQAFGAVTYLRSVGPDGVVSVNIVMSKTKVTPISVVSIPRLELEAAKIGARQLSYIKKHIEVKINKNILWTDSKNVQCWLQAEDPSKFKTYVAVRIGEILECTESRDWRWIPTAENVADDCTRDNIPADLSSSSRWFNGPAFLKKPEPEWPADCNNTEKVQDDVLEKKKEFCYVAIQHEEFLLPSNYSSWMKLLRVTAWTLRFKWNLMNKESKRKSACLSCEEIDEASLFWVKRSQQESFPEELANLEKTGTVSNDSRLFKLSPELTNGVICVNSRNTNSEHLCFEAKKPKILDKSHTVAKLIINWYHTKYGHHGHELICNEIRQRFWIIGLKTAVKQIARECAHCRLNGAKFVVPEMAALPSFRVTQPKRHFSFTGVDYFGPIDVVNGRKREKRYGVLFTCLSIRAVHLEVAFSLSTDDFLMAFERFVNVRGEPVEMWSDNGTNFKGAVNEISCLLQSMNQSKIQDKMSVRDVKWNFIPPGAPHMGGAWERLVRSVKISMNAIFKGRTLNDQLLMTVMAQAMGIVNSRPLTVVSTDLDDACAITPNCFLIGSTSLKQPPGTFDDRDLCSRKRWKQCQVLTQHFWSRWTKEYLPSLALRGKWLRKTENVKVGDLVFIVDSNELKNSWRKGVVEVVYPAKDGCVRVVDIRTATGLVRRPVTKFHRVPE